jgi:hypothetical protein
MRDGSIEFGGELPGSQTYIEDLLERTQLYLGGEADAYRRDSADGRPEQFLEFCQKLDLSQKAIYTILRYSESVERLSRSRGRIV